jgi:hypothetical protein
VIGTRWRQRRWRAMEIRRIILLPGLAGALAGLVAVAALLVLDVGSLGTLVLGPGGGFVPLAMLSVGFVVTFGPAAIGAAIMALARPEE